MLAKIKLETLECIRTDDSNGDEPFLWTIFFKIDGSTIKQSLFKNLSGEAVFHFTFGDHNNLGRPENSVFSGATIVITPELGEWITDLQPIAVNLLKEVLLIPGIIGSIVILMEEDATTDEAAVAGYQALCDFVKDEINGFISNLDLIEIKTQAEQTKLPNETLAQGIDRILKIQLNSLEVHMKDGADHVVKNAVFKEDIPGSLVDPDNQIDSQISYVDQDTLSKPPFKKDISKFLKSSDGAEYKLIGQIEGTPPPAPSFGFENLPKFAWRSLQGEVAGTPSIGLLRNLPHVFARGPHKTLSGILKANADFVWYRSINSDAFWIRLGSQKITGSPAAIALTEDRIDLFARGEDGALWHNWITDAPSEPSHDWVSLGGQILGSPSVCKGFGQIYVFARGLDNTIFHRRGSGSSWSDWERFGNQDGSITTTDFPVAVTSEDDNPRIFVRNQSGELMCADFFKWTGLKIFSSGFPAAVSMAPGRIDVFASDLNSSIQHAFLLPGQNWSTWEALGGEVSTPIQPKPMEGQVVTGDDTFSRSISVISKSLNHLDIFVRAKDGTIWRKQWQNGWVPVAGWDFVEGISAKNGPVGLIHRWRSGDLSGINSMCFAVDKKGAVQIINL
jgi:hypothetical protein